MQRRTPDAVRSRVMAAFEAVLSVGLAAAYLLAGPVLTAAGPRGGYLLGGVGVYYRTVNVTTPGTGYTSICDPWWGVCYPAVVPVDYIIGNKYAWDMGVDVGAGITYRVGEYAEVYAEARYHYIWGNEYTLPNGNKVKANGRYFPITFGFRF